MFLFATFLMAIGLLAFIGTFTKKVKEENPPEKIKQMRIGSSIAFIIGIVLVSLSSSETKNNCPLDEGSEYILKVKDTMLPVPVAAKPEYLDLHIRVLTNDDTLTLEEKQKDTLLLKNKAIIVVPAETKIKLERIGFINSKIFIKEGKYAGNEGYVRNDWIRCGSKK